MRAMLKSASADIFDHIRKTPNRDFTLRLSAVEIYNEVSHFASHAEEGLRGLETGSL